MKTHMYGLTPDQYLRTQSEAARETRRRLVTLFEQPTLTRAQKIDAAYKVVKDQHPTLSTSDYLVQARALILAADEITEQRARDTADRAETLRRTAATALKADTPRHLDTASELMSAALDALFEAFPGAVEILDTETARI